MVNIDLEDNVKFIIEFLRMKSNTADRKLPN